jgi:hypothetical protein
MKSSFMWVPPKLISINTSMRSHPHGWQLAITVTYTRLRNQIGHQRQGATVESTREEMALVMNDFMTLVKGAIQNAQS